MHNFNAKVRVTVCFLDIAEGQINIAKVYFHVEMTTLKGYVSNWMYVTYTIYSDMKCVFEVHKVVNMPVSVSKLSFYTDVNLCNQKKNIPLNRIFHW